MTVPAPAAPDPAVLRAFARATLLEDLGQGAGLADAGAEDRPGARIPDTARDATTALVDRARPVRARIDARAATVACGAALALAVFEVAAASDDGPGPRVLRAADDGADLAAGETLLELEAGAGAVLTGERSALNLVARLCGIAHAARRATGAAAGRVTVLDTRKTTPGLRALERWAVRAGGATNHRDGLHDMVLVKENHLDLLRDGDGDAARADAVKRAVAAARRRSPDLPVEVECRSLEEARAAVDAGADLVLLDNRTPDELRRWADLLVGGPPLEASGGITPETVPAYADTGVQRVSIGALTHAAPAADLTLLLHADASGAR